MTEHLVQVDPPGVLTRLVSPLCRHLVVHDRDRMRFWHPANPAAPLNPEQDLNISYGRSL
jgi:hypothetical protein